MRSERANPICATENTAANGNPSEAIIVIRGNSNTNISNLNGRSSINRNHAAKKEAFFPFEGTTKDFQQTPAFQQIAQEHDFVLVKADVTHCISSSDDTQANKKGTRCEKGVTISTLDWSDCCYSTICWK